MDCLPSYLPTVMSAVSYAMAALAFLEAVVFFYVQYQTKGKDAITRFTLLTGLMSLGIILLFIGTASTKHAEYCKLKQEPVSLFVYNIGSGLFDIAYVLFIYIRSKALVSPRFRRLVEVLCAIVVLFCTIYFILTPILTVIDAELYVPILSTLRNSTVLLLLLDIYFCVLFILHLRQLKKQREQGLGGVKRDPLGVIADYGLKTCLLIFFEGLCGGMSGAMSGSNVVVSVIIYYFSLILYWLSVYYTMRMKLEVDRCLAENEKADTMSGQTSSFLDKSAGAQSKSTGTGTAASGVSNTSKDEKDSKSTVESTKVAAVEPVLEAVKDEVRIELDVSAQEIATQADNIV